MCYSAQVWTDYRRYQREFGVDIDIQSFYDLFYRRRSDPRIRIPKGVSAAFLTSPDDDPRLTQIRAWIAEFDAAQALQWQQELFSQRTRLAEAQRSLHKRTTKAAQESQRIATAKIDRALARLADLHRTEPREEDARIFPGHYAPVMVMENGRRVLKPMRYQCRPSRAAAAFDRKFPGTYNARRDNLEGFWREQFGHHHAIAVVSAFYENVNRHKMEGRDLADGEPVSNVVLEFRPQPAQDMLVACLWSHWSGPGEPDLLSFAAITDEPPPEIAAAGHDRCIIPIRPEAIDRWLAPDPTHLAHQYAILDDRPTPYYEHRLAA